MSNENIKQAKVINGVMLNAYPDSIGQNLGDLISMLERPELKDAFSLFYVLPTFFNSDLDLSLIHI
jgi:sucrose phosphorylase